MAYVKCLNESYTNIGAMQALMHYINRKAIYIGGLAVSIHDIEASVREFMIVKQIFNKQEGRQARHFIVSFSPDEEDSISAEGALSIGYEIAQHYGNRYQIIFAVHDRTDNLHLHLVFNTVSFIDGKMYADGYEDFNNLVNHVDSVVKNFLSVSTQRYKA